MPPRAGLSSLAPRPVTSCSYVCPSCRFQEGVRRGTARSQSLQINHPHDFTRNISVLTQAQRARPFRDRSIRRPDNFHLKSKRSSSNGTLTSRTAVNAPTSVPLELRELHQHLLQLQEKATSYVDLSRLQLALRSLESGDPAVRVAFLGLGTNGLQAARRLARALLADALGSEEEWEKKLVAGGDDRGLLIRYGDTVEDSGVQGGTPLLQTFDVPSPFLQKYRLEIMIAPLNAYNSSPSNSEASTQLEETILVPPVTIPTSAGGRVGFVRYPVHNALIVAEGINGAVEYGRFPDTVSDGNLINSALSLPLRSSTGAKSTEVVATGNAVDIDLANHALDIFRASNANGAIFGEEWQTSRVGTIANWLSASTGSASTDRELKPAVEALILSILARGANAISTAESTATATATSLNVSDTVRASLQSSLAAWAEEAHRDLQVNLATALVSPSWRRTAWWRLFWRIDEVSLSATDLLRNGWLVEAEQSLAFLSGRVLEAGVATVSQLKAESLSTPPTPSPSSSSSSSSTSSTSSSSPSPPPTTLLDEAMTHELAEYKSNQLPSARPSRSETVAELMQLPPMLARVRRESGLNALFDPPWPQTITLARQQKLHREVPALHRAAQGLMLRALSTMGGGGALAAWLWAASGGVAVYEAGAVAALGFVWAMRRLQTRWGALRDGFADSAREDGRRVLGDLEGRLAKMVRDGGRREVREEDRRAWGRAREGIEACLAALERVGAGKGDGRRV